MKRTLLVALLCLYVLSSFAQNNLHSVIRNANGVSQHFVTLQAADQATFQADKISSLLGINEASSLVLINSHEDQLGMTHYRYYQTYQGIPIENTMYLVHTKDNLITGLSGSIITDFETNMAERNVTSLSPNQAIHYALQSVNAIQYMWQDGSSEQSLKAQTGKSDATYFPAAELVWYNTGVEADPRGLRLAYKVDVYAKEPLSRQYIYVDAQTGKVMGKQDRLWFTDATGTANTAYSGTQTIHSDLNAGSYRLRDYTKGSGVITLKSNGSDYSSAAANWSLSSPDQYALDAHFGVSSTWSFYNVNFGRNSVNNSGYALTSYVNESATTNNAYWDGSTMHFGVRSTNNAGITAIDVAGHELTHGVTQYTCNLTYSYQSGAMNESLSDIMGKSVQFWQKPTDINWQLSNDMNWLIRDMSNPNAYSQPDTYLGTNWYTGSSDNGGVHTNSGVGNFMFYLLVNGGSGTNDLGTAYSVTGIGLSAADQIIYRTQTVYLVSSSQYNDWRTACINAATDLYGAASNEVTQVQNAWTAVGVGGSGGGGGGYCTSNGTSQSYEYIDYVSLGSISRTSGAESGGYYNGTSSSTNVTAGSSYTLTTSAGFTSSTYTEYWAVYVDWNIDGDFADAGETEATGTSTGTGNNSLTISVPSTATAGTTRMRVSMHYGSTPAACGTFDYGEVEDYSLNVETGGGSCGTPSGLNASSVTSSSATLGWTTVSGATSYNVQYKLSSSGTWTTTTSATNSLALSGLSASTSYDFQVQAVCAGGSSSYSSPSSFTTSSSGGCTETYEPNNTSGTAAAISFGVDISSQISTSSDNDYYSFANSSSAKNIKLTLTNLPADYDLRLFKPNGSTAKSSTNGGTTSETIIYNTSTVGTYKIRVWGYNGAYSTSQCYILHVYTSATPFKLDESGAMGSDKDLISLYPNPAASSVTLEYNEAASFDGTVRVLNLLGQSMLEERHQLNAGDRIQLNVSALPSGQYFVSMTSQDFQTVRILEVIK